MAGARCAARGGEEAKVYLLLENLAPASRLDAGAISFLSPVMTHSTRVGRGPPRMEDQ